MRWNVSEDKLQRLNLNPGKFFKLKVKYFLFMDKECGPEI